MSNGKTAQKLTPLENENKSTMVCVDWANVYGWHRNRTISRVDKVKQEVDAKKLFAFLKSFGSVDKVRLYYGLDKAKDYAVGNISRWVERRTGKKFIDIGNLAVATMKLTKNKTYSDDFHDQIRQIIEEYYSSKRLNNFKKIGYEVISKDVKMRRTSLLDLPKFKKVIGRINASIDALLLDSESDDTTIDEELREKIELLKAGLTDKVKDRKCDFDVEITVDIIKDLDNFDNFFIVSGDGDYAPLIRYLRQCGKYVAILSQSDKLGGEIPDLDERLRPQIIFAESEKDPINSIWKDKA